MKILLANKYFFIKGGAENSFFQTANLLREKGHEIIFFSMHHDKNFSSAYEKYFVSNIDYDNNGFLNKIKASSNIIYSIEARKKFERLLDKTKPDLIHLNNIYHQISPSILHSIQQYKIPVVMTLRDYKMVCASYLLLANGKICESCRGGKYHYSLVRKCVKNSYAKSMLNVIEMYLHHKMINIYDIIDTFIAPSEFLIAKIRDMGFHRKIHYLPNFVNLDEFQPQYHTDNNSIIYFGRLSKEKGLFTLIRAMKDLDVQLKIVGEGPLGNTLQAEVQRLNLNNVNFLGYLSGNSLKTEIKNSNFVVLPSECYENNPRSIIEGFALGKPAICSNIGGSLELVKDNITGSSFIVGNERDLNKKIKQLISDPVGMVNMGKNARLLIENKFNAEAHYKQLLKIYDLTLTK